ncbi:PucR family transcriptional regulator [Streptomyces cellulosae]|uniref:PucR family transcriptional regulator n=1 Tax=Streptomyces cellulosae TaxID=1968 RepID=UPI00068A91A7|nr:helix-turn-helix domain-containing protein [Streptomyces cellulosae]
MPAGALAACLADAAWRAKAMAEDGASAADITEMLAEFLVGVRESLAEDNGSAVEGHPPSGAADDLLDGQIARWTHAPWLAARYAVCVIRSMREAERTEAQAGMAAIEGLPGVLMTRRAGNDVVLVPDEEEGRTREMLSALADQYGINCWIAVASRTAPEVASGHREALDILRLTIADRRPAGTYRIDDLLVERAVAQSDRIRAALARIVRPLAQHPTLRETLVAWLDADCSRPSTSRHLFIHPSTLDYRLRRVHQLTGFDPTSLRDSRTLSAALLVERLV